MRIGYHLNKEDFVHFNYHALESLPSAPKAYRADRIATALVIVVTITATATLIHYRLSTAMISLAIASAFAVHLFVTYAKTHKLERFKKLRATFEGADLDGLVGQRWLDLTDQGLIEYSEGQTTSVAWNRVKRVGFDGGRIYIYGDLE